MIYQALSAMSLNKALLTALPGKKERIVVGKCTGSALQGHSKSAEAAVASFKCI